MQFNLESDRNGQRFCRIAEERTSVWPWVRSPCDGASRLKLGSGFSGEKVVSGVRIDKTSVSEVEKSGVRILVWNGERTESVLPRVSVSEAEDLGVRILE